jgi:O-methyltransferase
MIGMLQRIIRRLICRIFKISIDSSQLAKFDVKHLSRALSCNKYFEIIHNIDGSVVEAGVGQGRGLAIWASLALNEGKNRKVWAFDSFEGFPPLVAQDEASADFTKGLDEYKKFDIPYVRSTLIEFGLSINDIDRTISVVKGFIPNSCKMYNGGVIALLYLDLDIYEGYRDALAFFYDKVSPGGVIAFDEYLKPLDTHKWPGAARAINEFLEDKGLYSNVRICKLTGNRFLVKPA